MQNNPKKDVGGTFGRLTLFNTATSGEEGGGGGYQWLANTHVQLNRGMGLPLSSACPPRPPPPKQTLTERCACIYNRKEEVTR